MTTSIYYIQLINEIKSEVNVNRLESFEYEITPLLQYNMISEVEFNKLVKLAENMKRKVECTTLGGVL